MADVAIDVYVEFCDQDGEVAAVAWKAGAFRLAVMPRTGELMDPHFLSDLNRDVPWEVPFDWITVDAVRHLQAEEDGDEPKVELVFRLPEVTSLAQLQSLTDKGWHAELG